ncbi:hypothetical protein BOSEA31B_12383 [Hyphomicrobiales bacterium]|nr:hypothetical protein BOSEA31B_12383 [Hyphomicrobiales bacterium]CAH1698163.1 hypothetical protein BOSEA1005_11208 [Hyphomicrobiales bacterium]CAI0347806.1 hypothetical protein BO1005MUT1_90167 [Hyphomicrobiales bacterium]
MTESGTVGDVAGTKPLLPQQTVQEAPHEMSYLTKPTIQAEVTREQESPNLKTAFPQAIRNCAVKRILSATLSAPL